MSGTTFLYRWKKEQLQNSNPITLVNDKPLVGNRLTTYTLALCDWNATLERALLGARLILSVQKGWNDGLPYARVLDDSLKLIVFDWGIVSFINVAS